MASVLQHRYFAFIYTFLPVFGLISLNLVATELEMPFGEDDNDLPLADFQDHMNNSMLMLIREESDLVPHLGKYHQALYHDIKINISNERPDWHLHAMERKHTFHGSSGDGTLHEKFQANGILNAFSEKGDPAMPGPGPAAPAAVAPAGNGASPLPPGSEMAAALKLDVLGGVMDSFIEGASGLSKEMSQSMNRLQELQKSTAMLSSNLGQSSEVVEEFSFEMQSLLPKRLEFSSQFSTFLNSQAFDKHCYDGDRQDVEKKAPIGAFALPCLNSNSSPSKALSTPDSALTNCRTPS